MSQTKSPGMRALEALNDNQFFFCRDNFDICKVEIEGKYLSEADSIIERETGVNELTEALAAMTNTQEIFREETAKLLDENVRLRENADAMAKALDSSTLGYQVLRTMTLKVNLNLAACVADEHLCEMRTTLAAYRHNANI